MIFWAKIVFAILIAAVIGYSIGRYIQPARIVTKTETIVKEVSVVKRNIVTTEHEVKRPDGTVIVDTKSEDHSAETTNINSVSKQEVIVTNSKPQWRVRGLAGIDVMPFGGPLYSASIERRIIGPLFVYGDTNKVVGLSINFEF